MLVNGGIVEMSYVVWVYVWLLVKCVFILFLIDYKNFYFRGSDLGVVKSLKFLMFVVVVDV